MTFGFHVGSKNLWKLLCVSCEVFVLHGYDWIHWVAKSCTTTAYRWLFRDSQLSLRTLWSAVIKSPKSAARGTASPLRLLHGSLRSFLSTCALDTIAGWWSFQHGSLRSCLSTLSLDTIAGWWSIPYGSLRSCLATLSLDTVEDVMVGETDELKKNHWSTRMSVRVHRRAFRAIILLAYPRGLS